MAKILDCLTVQKEMLLIEANIIASIYANPNLLIDNDNITKDMFKNEKWKCFFIIAKTIISQESKALDENTVETYLSLEGKVNKTLKGYYEKYGGYTSVEFSSEIVDTDSFDLWVNKLKLYSSLYDYISTCTFYENDIENIISKLNANELYDYISAKVNNVFINTDNSICKPKEILDGIDSMIEKANKGLNMGLPIKSEILNAEVKGLVLGQIYGIMANSGVGKTTIVIETILSSIWEHDESCVMILNEQDLEKMQQQLLTWVINNVINPHKKFASSRWLEGCFTEEELNLINKAKEILKEKKKNGKIIIQELQTYTCKAVVRIIKKYAGLGVKYFILDTFKVSGDATGEQWQSLVADSVTLYNLIKPSNLNVNLVLTAQLEKGRASVSRYLNESNIGVGKNIKDVMSVILMVRHVYNDEYINERFALKVEKPLVGTTATQECILNKNKNYQIIFIDKNRNGVSNKFQIVAEQNLGWLTYKEVGITNISFGT